MAMNGGTLKFAVDAIIDIAYCYYLFICSFAMHKDIHFIIYKLIY